MNTREASAQGLDRVLALLAASDADAWEVTDSHRTCWEFYFIGHRLDQNRVRSVEHTRVRVYRRSADGRFLGSASGEIPPTASEAEAQAMIDRLLEQAALVENPYYELRKPTEGEAGAAAEAADDTAAFSVEGIARQFLEAMAAVEETEGEYINSYEIFVSDIRRRFLSSTGIDVTSRFPYSLVEVVVNARADAEEIELYRMYTSGSCDPQALQRDIRGTMAYGKDRLLTKTTPAIGTAPVLFSTDAALQIYEYYLERMNAAYIYQKISDCKLGEPVMAQGGAAAAGEGLTIRAVRYLANSSANAAYDPEGAPIRDLDLIRDGVAAAYWGGRQFSQYLGLEESFIPGNFQVEGGRVSAAVLRQGRYLEVVEFSDFQVNSMTGDIAGEIRLGYWHDGQDVQIVSGGSVSGNMQALEGGLSFSSETRQYDNFVIPAVTRLEGMSITGAE